MGSDTDSLTNDARFLETSSGGAVASAESLARRTETLRHEPTRAHLVLSTARLRCHRCAPADRFDDVRSRLADRRQDWSHRRRSSAWWDAVALLLGRRNG